MRGELQETIVGAAILAIVHHDWRAPSLHHGSGFVEAVRALFSAWYATGRLTGRYHDRLDLLGDYIRNPLPFVVTGRVFVVVVAALTIALVWRLGRSLFDPMAGALAAALLALSPVHVRGSTQVWYDVPAAAVVVGAVLAAVGAVRRGGLARVALTGALAGGAIAAKHSMFPVAAPLVLTTVLAPPPGMAATARRFAAASVAAFLAYAVLSPYPLLEPRAMYAALWLQGSTNVMGSTHGLSLAELTSLGIGWSVVAAAALGLVAAVGRAPAVMAIVAAFPLSYGLLLAIGSAMFIRYFAALAPFTALFAGYGIALIGRTLAPRHAQLAALVVLAMVAWSPARRSIGFVTFLARDDTRVLAGNWLRDHAGLGSFVVVPDLAEYANPALPVGQLMIRLRYPAYVDALRARGVIDATTPFRVGYDGLRFNHDVDSKWSPAGDYFVTAEHVSIRTQTNPTERMLSKIRTAKWRPVARFTGSIPHTTERAVFDILDADYTPLDGFGALERPGPDIIIWAPPP